MNYSFKDCNALKRHLSIPLLLLGLLLVFTTNTYGQTAKDYFIAVEQRIQGLNSFHSLQDTLNRFMKQHIPSRSGLTLQLDRTLDVSYTHKRLMLQLNYYSFQLDFITMGDSVYFTALTNSDDGRLKSFNAHESKLEDYLSKRNKLYRSKKKLSDIQKELTYPHSFAMYCGDTAPLTTKGEQILKLVDEQDIEAFRIMIQSISPEVQAYGVLGMELLEKREVPLLPFDRWLVQHLKKRDTDVVTCSGCIDGIVSKLYGK